MSIIKSSTISLVEKGIVTVLNLILLAILARLLDPKDFGMFAIILAVQSLFQPLVDMGLTPVYVKAKHPTRELSNSLFTLNLLLGVFNMILLWLVTPFISIIYDNKLLLHLISVFSISVFLSSMSRQGYAQLVRDKRFDRIFIITVVSNAIAFIVSAYFAYKNIGVWTFIIKAIVLNLVLTIMIYSFNKRHYRIVSFTIIKKFTVELKFGFGVFLNRVLNGVFNGADKFLFGKLYNTEILGHYSNSQQIARMADTHIRTPITSAVYSYLERYGDNDKKKLYDKLASLVFLITSLFSGILILEGDLLLIYLLGEKWTFASEFVQPLGFFGMAMVLKGTCEIISMSEDSLKLQNIKVLGSIGVISIIFFIVYFAKLEALTLVYILSSSFFVYWLLITYLELNKFNEVKVSSFLKTVLFLAILISTLLLLKYIILNRFVELLTVGFIYITIICLVLARLYLFTYNNNIKPLKNKGFSD